MSIPINKKGFILNEGEPEPYIIVQDDISNTGGYLILVSAIPDPGMGHDYWVLEGKLEDFFQEAQWKVEWPD